MTNRVLSAVAWLEVNSEGTCRQAAAMYEVSEIEILAGIKIRAEMVRAFNKANARLAFAAVHWMAGERGRSARLAAEWFKIPAAHIVLAKRVLVFDKKKIAALRRERPTLHKVAKREREKCAKIAESMGGEHGAAIAEAIRVAS